MPYGDAHQHISILLNTGYNKPKWAILKRYWLIGGAYTSDSVLYCIVLASILSPVQYAGQWSMQCAYTCMAVQLVQTPGLYSRCKQVSKK